MLKEIFDHTPQFSPSKKNSELSYENVQTIILGGDFNLPDID